MIQVSCRAALTCRLLLDCAESDPAVAIVKRHMKAAAMQAALELKRLDAGYEVDLDMDSFLSYRVDG